MGTFIADTVLTILSFVVQNERENIENSKLKESHRQKQIGYSYLSYLINHVPISTRSYLL